MDHDYAFEMAASAVRFGVGVTREVGADLAELGAKRVLVLTDPTLVTLAPVHAVLESLEAAARRASRCSIACAWSPPTSRSTTPSPSPGEDAFDAFVAVGGGSTIDTAKAANLYTCYPPADFLDYVNPPIGKGLPGARAAEAADRHPHHGRHGQRDHRRQHLRPEPRCTPRPASRTAG